MAKLRIPAKKNVQLCRSWTHEMMPFGHTLTHQYQSTTMTTVRHTSRNVSAFFLWCANITPNECASNENPKAEGLISYIFNRMMLVSAFCALVDPLLEKRTFSHLADGMDGPPSCPPTATLVVLVVFERGLFLSFWPVGNPLNRPESVSERSEGPGGRYYSIRSQLSELRLEMWYPKYVGTACMHGCNVTKPTKVYTQRVWDCSIDDLVLRLRFTVVVF